MKKASVCMLRVIMEVPVFLLLTLIFTDGGMCNAFTIARVEAAEMPGIDDDAILTVDQAGSIAPSKGNYGWDSRGAIISYYSMRGEVSGSLGTVYFADRTGKRTSFLWDSWGGEFPEWWSRMLAEKVRSNANDSEIGKIREAFSSGLIFDCVWIIAVGLKSEAAGGALYKTLRQDDTLRVSYGFETDTLIPPERLFFGDEMFDSLGAVLPGERWGEGTLSTFSERNPYSYSVQINSYDVNIYATNCVECASKGIPGGSSLCTHAAGDDYFCVRQPIEYEGRVYSGGRTFAWEGQTVLFNEPMIEGYERDSRHDDFEGVRGTVTGNRITPTGDCNVFLSYTKTEIPDEHRDLIVRYVELNPKGTGIAHEVGEVTVKDAIEKNSLFSVRLQDSMIMDGVQYRLDERAVACLSYAASPKYVNAIRGTKAYEIEILREASEVLCYKSKNKYEADSAGTLFVPVLKPENGEDEDSDDSGSSGESEKPQEGDISEEANHDDSVSHISEITSSENPNASVIIKSDIFDPEIRIPSGERVCVNAEAVNFLYSLEAERVSGRWPIKVRVIYDEETEYIVTVYREYSYVRLKSFGYYILDEIMVTNNSLNCTPIRLNAHKAGILFPVCKDPIVYGGGVPFIGGNLELPTNYSGEVSAQWADDSAESPTYEDALEVAEAAVGEMRCRNDEVIFDSQNLLGSCGWQIGETDDAGDYSLPGQRMVTLDSRFYDEYRELFIIPKARNGVYSSSGVVRYQPVIRYGNNTLASLQTVAVNRLTVHTPVLCNLELTECDSQRYNIEFNQESVEPDSAMLQLVVGQSESIGIEKHESDSCDFFLKISNIGYHPGYASILGESYDYYFCSDGISDYVDRNLVRFPFDVFIDIGNDREGSNDIAVESGEWYEVGTEKIRVRVPDYVCEGDYCIEVRSLGCNAYSNNDFIATSTKNGKARLEANISSADYVASDSAMVHVSGKLYGLNLYDVSDKNWHSVFNDGTINKYTARKEQGLYRDGTLESVLPSGRVSEAEIGEYAFSYYVGTGNELGLDTGRSRIFELPVLKGNIPITEQINGKPFSTGSTFSFEVNTSSYEMSLPGAYLVITPEFSVQISDNTTEQIDLFYPASYRGKSAGLIRIGSSEDRKNIRTCYHKNNNLSSVRSCSYSYDRIVAVNPIPSTKSVFARTWRFEYSLPAELYAFSKETAEQCKGFLMVKFDIAAFDRDGNEIMNYVSPFGYCNMWLTEGQQTFRRDAEGNEFTIAPGTVLCFELVESNRQYVVRPLY